MTGVAKKIRVALMTYAMDNRPGKGTALYARRLVEELIKLQDPNLELILVHYDQVLADSIYRQAEEIIMPRVRLPFGSHFVSQLMFFWRHRRQRFDIIHWFQPRLYPFFWLAPANHLVVTIHGAGMITSPGKIFNFANLIFNQTLIWFNRYVSAVIAGSRFGKQEIVNAYGVAAHKIAITYYGGGDRFMPLNQEEARTVVGQKLGLTRKYFLSVSRLQPHKNVDSIIRSFILYREQHPTDQTILAVVGWPTEDYDKTYQLARQSKWSEDIIFIDHVDDRWLNQLYSGAEAFIFLSLNEGFGLPVIEAMASGTPVIVANTTSLPEVSGGHALVVEPFDYQATAEALHRIISDPDFRKELVDQGQNWAREFSWHRTAQATSKIYQDLVK